MLNVAASYSRKWRFKFNANKSCILLLKGNRVNHAFVWTLGDTRVRCLISCCHLGILINDNHPCQSAYKPLDERLEGHVILSQILEILILTH